MTPTTLARTDSSVAPLSYAQERLWYIETAAPGTPTYNVPLLVRWTQAADADALAEALAAVADRHEVLRTTYRLHEDRPVQVVGDPGSVPLEVVDLADHPEAGSAARRQADERARVPFDLAGEAPWRCTLWRGVPGGDLLLITIHHIAVDGWSLAPLFEDLAAAYEAAVAGASPAFEPLPVRYADFAVADRAAFDARGTRAVLAERVAELTAVPGGLVLGNRRAGGRAGPTRAGAEHRFTLPATTWAATCELAGALGATPYVVLLAAFQTVLARWSGRDDFLIGTVAANRPRSELERLVGFFANTVPVRCRPGADRTFAELCTAVRTEAFRALSYQRVPYDQLVAALPAGYGDPVDVAFVLQNAPTAQGPARWAAPQQLATGTAKFDVAFVLEEGEEGLTGLVEYDVDRYRPDVATALAEGFVNLLGAAVTDPGRPVSGLPLSTPAAGMPAGTLVGESRTPAHRTVLEAIDTRLTGLDPDACAVTCAGVDTSWRELDGTSWWLADRLAAAGVPVGGRVPVVADRGGALVAGWLGVLRAGAAYTPLNPDTPVDKLEHIVTELGAAAIVLDATGRRLVDADLLDRLGVPVVRLDEATVAEPPPGRRPAPVDGDDPAVIIYTSGTTGRPKGAVVPHRSLLNTIAWWNAETGLDSTDRLLCAFSVSFDPASFETFRALVAGAQLIMADEETRRDPRLLARLLHGPHGATTMSLTPSLCRAVLDADEETGTSLRRLYIGGEALPRHTVERCARQWGVPVVNVYGPTEASCISTFALTDPADPRPPAIGRPLPNTRAYVLGPHLEELPAGVAGELCLAGAGVSLGYLGDPERTAVAFPVDPWDPGRNRRIYRTGDRVALRRDGLLEYLGRVDEQVKILGHRIEPGEVARLMEDQPGVRAAAVHPVGDPPRLVAYVQLDTDGMALPGRDDLVRPLQRWLPPAVLPTDVYAVDALPRTGNDKVDFAALAALPSTRLAHTTVAARRLTAAEAAVAALFGDVLSERGEHTDPLGPDDSFFTLGGHSLLAVRLLAEAQRRTGRAVPLRDFLTEPTVAGLARLLAADDTAVEEDDAETSGGPAPDEGGSYPATPIQQRLWAISRLPALGAAYLSPLVVRLTGAVDRDRLAAAVRDVLGRHPALRSRFRLVRTERRVRYRTDGPPPAVIRVDDVPPAELAARVQDACWAPFDLAVDAPARAYLLGSGPRTLLVLTVHHIAADGWSMQLLLDQIGESYRAGVEGRAPVLPPPVHPAALAGAVVGAEADGRVAAVVERLRGAPTDIHLPHDRPRPSVQPVTGATVSRRLTAELTERIRAATRPLGATTFMTTAAVLAVALAHRGDQRDFLFAYPWGGREAREAADAVAMLVNTAVLRVDLTGAPTWREVLRRVQEESLAGYRDADAPFDAVAAALHPDRDLSRPPITPVYLAAGDVTPAPPSFGPDVTADAVPLTATRVKFELEVGADALPDGLVLTAAYATELFDERSVADLLDDCARCASDLAADLDSPALKGNPL
ncbi:amino acid adenylation domain-containing protein [Micromonospora sp. WMMD961]|uniref:non-ribosomal peptide synthetase n=1 Tax=Micromonospora sp. WMMD961 TaxID=3016100 RepID=UPI0024160958|nr:non-ribosomal peptide synthetase [Micromonospora sp. WMMD961]MDG4780086.1 amino acid adenylation domain-containing protein [Micromonospora sp. WMMD961]